VSAAVRPQREGFEVHLPGVSCRERHERDVQEGGGRLRRGKPVERATTIRVRNGKLSGLLLIEARDLKEAIQVAAKMPVARGGSIELRPIKELHP